MITAILIGTGGELDRITGTQSEVAKRIASWAVTLMPGDIIRIDD